MMYSSLGENELRWLCSKNDSNQKLIRHKNAKSKTFRNYVWKINATIVHTINFEKKREYNISFEMLFIIFKRQMKTFSLWKLN